MAFRLKNNDASAPQGGGIDFSKHPAKRDKQKRIDLNPSSADRWTTCTASPGYIFDNWHLVPPDQDTVYNTEGTTAHEVASALLQGRKPNLKDSYACPVPPTPEMYKHAWAYSEYIEKLITSRTSSKVLVEQKLPLWYMPGRNAIVDAAVINPDSLHVIDYKYGAGIIVSTERNLQGIIYAFSIGRDKNFPNNFPVTIHIYQPRGRAAEDSPSHSWKTTWGEICAIAVEIGLAAEEIQFGGLFPENGLKFHASEKACQWCPAKAFCTARVAHLARHFKPLGALNKSMVQLAETSPPKTLTLEQLAAIVAYGDQVTKWIKDAQAYALTFMKTGGKLPGFKLVTSRGGNRYWKNPTAAGKLLLSNTNLRENEVWEKTLISVAGVEELLGKQSLNVELTNLIGKSPGHPVIAPVTDKRPAIAVDPAIYFDKLGDVPKVKVSLDQF